MHYHNHVVAYWLTVAQSHPQTEDLIMTATLTKPSIRRTGSKWKLVVDERAASGFPQITTFDEQAHALAFLNAVAAEQVSIHHEPDASMIRRGERNPHGRRAQLTCHECTTTATHVSAQRLIDAWVKHALVHVHRSTFGTPKAQARWNPSTQSQPW